MSNRDDIINAVHIAAATIWARGSLTMEDAVAQAFDLRAKVEDELCRAERDVRREMKESKLKS
mgnify:CR=1 FL=1